MTIIIKRDGRKEQLDLNKIHTVVEWACDKITGVSISEVELKSQIQFYAGITSEEIHETLIRSASELISEETPNYQFVASKLINFDLRKRAYGHYEPWHIKDIVKRGVQKGFYNPDLLSVYNDEDWAFMEGVINHNRDYEISYAGMVQFRTKYLVKNKSTMEYFETPQIAYMLIAASGCISEESKDRLKFIKKIYNHLSKFDFTLPTPIMAGLRTNVKQFSSCTLIDAGDSLDSINAAASAIVKYAANKAGIGLNIGRIRAVGSPIRNGEVTHTGVVPFIKYFNAALKSCNQGGVRNSSGTFYYPMWHYEYEDMIVLKNNKGTEDTRVRSVDYGVQLNRFLIQRLIEDGNITLFSPNDVPDLYEAFFTNQELFGELYVKYENDSSIRKKTITAIEAFSVLAQERVETGRIYIQFVDNTNEQGMLGEENPVYMSNLCLVGDTKIDVICDNQPFKINIEDLGNFMRKYDNVVVKSYNTDTKAVEYMPIEAFGLTNPDADLYQVTTDDDTHSVVCTSDHLFWTDNRGYVAAIDLTEEDRIKTL
jgi:ribonucleoside-diphosphate reductase alpha chain